MKRKFDSIKISTLFSTIATFILVLLAYYQLIEGNEIAKGDFAHRFKTDFFTEQTRDLITLFDNDLLDFKILSNTNQGIEFGYFIIDNSKLKFLSNASLNVLGHMKNIYTAYEIDDFLLSHFEDLGLYKKKKLLDIDYIYHGFDWYVECIYDNKEIKKYLKWATNDESSADSYDN
ncbi:MAG: hypothetical protein ABSC11_14810, partial [Smithella sp.]